MQKKIKRLEHPEEIDDDEKTSFETIYEGEALADVFDRAVSKLSTKVQESLGKADSAVQSIAEGGTNGTLSIDGVEVPVHGLGSAAFTGSDAYDAAGSAKAIEDKLEEYKKSNDEALKGAQDGVADLEPRVAANEAAVADHETRIAALEGIEYATTADIDAMFEEE